MMCEGEVKGADYCWFRTDSGIGVIFRGVDRVSSRKGVRWGHLRSRSDFPDDVKVL